jgi:hypothetical protein
MTTAKTYLEDLKHQLASVMQDLATMPKHKAGSDWHEDRVREAWWLVAAIEKHEKSQA